MKTEDQQKIWAANHVIVNKGSMSDTSICHIPDCNRHDTYIICVGGTKLSNLFCTSCAEHLSENIDKAIEYRNDLCQKEIKRIDENVIEEAKKIVAQHIDTFGIFKSLNHHE